MSPRDSAIDMWNQFIGRSVGEAKVTKIAKLCGCHPITIKRNFAQYIHRAPGGLSIFKADFVNYYEVR